MERPMKRASDHARPTSAVFADGSKSDRLLALHPDAIGVTFNTRPGNEIAPIKDGVAVLCIEGPLEHKGGGGWWCFWDTYEQIHRDFVSLLESSDVSAIVLKFDSPGGEVSGLTETVRVMRAAKEASGKRVIAYVDEDCYSAAYALAQVADEIYLPEAGGVGSIGVITAMIDCTEMDKKNGLRFEVIASGSKKADGHPHVPLSDGAIARTKKRVDTLAAQFFELVAEQRGLTTEAIEAMQAGVYAGTDAVRIGLADGVMSLSECLTLAGNLFGSPSTPTERSAGKEKDSMTAPLAAAKALNDATAKLAAAKTDAERAKAAALVVTAEADFVEATGATQPKPAAKVKKTKTVTTDTHEEVVDDGEEDEPADDDEGDDDESMEPECDDDEDAEADAKNAGHTTSALVALARKITGKKSIEQVMGALHALGNARGSNAKLAAKVAKLEADANAGKLEALIARGLTAGQLAPAQRAWARTMTPAGLKAYLDTAPRMVHTKSDEHTEAKTTGHELGTVTAEMARIWRKLGHAEKDFPALLAKMNNSASRANGAS
jgi:ClpP class serine protease